MNARIGRFEDEPLRSITEISGQRSRRQAVPKTASGLTISRILVGSSEYQI